MQHYQLTQGVTVWFTGLPSSGKTTLARLLEEKCRAWGVAHELLDGDIVRTNLGKGLGFTKEDRDVHIERIGFVADLLTRHGVMAIVSAIAPYRQTREKNRQRIGRYVEVFVKTSQATCEKRDVKGLYRKARSGAVQAMTGVSDPYEDPLRPEVICETEKETPEESLSKVIGRIAELGYLRAL